MTINLSPDGMASTDSLSEGIHPTDLCGKRFLFLLHWLELSCHHPSMGCFGIMSGL